MALGIGLGWDRIISSQVFFPDRVMVSDPSDFRMEFEELWMTSADGTRIHGWHIPAPEPIGLLLFCHGNAGNISHRLDNITYLHRIGLSVLIFDYREYGQSEGSITEPGFYLDAEAAYQKALEMAHKESLKLVIFGRSLGGVAAVYLAHKLDCSGLILESTFTNLADMATSLFHLPLADKVLKDRFSSLKRIPEIKAPLLFFHGDEDELVGFDLGRKLFAAAPEPKRFQTLQGAGHNDTYAVGGTDYFQQIKEFVEGLE